MLYTGIRLYTGFFYKHLRQILYIKENINIIFVVLYFENMTEYKPQFFCLKKTCDCREQSNNHILNHTTAKIEHASNMYGLPYSIYFEIILTQ